MTKRPALDPMESVVAETPTVAAPAKEAAAARLKMLDGDEIIQLSIRPSPWFIALYAYKLVIVATLLVVILVVASRGRATLGISIALTVVVVAGFAGVVAATLQWASRLYVLTNRRVMRFHGVFNVDVVECGLDRIGAVELEQAWFQLPLNLGSLQMRARDTKKPDVVWEHVARPDEVRQIVVKAISKSQSR